MAMHIFNLEFPANERKRQLWFAEAYVMMERCLMFNLHFVCFLETRKLLTSDKWRL